MPLSASASILTERPPASSNRSKPPSRLCWRKAGLSRDQIRAIGVGFGGPVDCDRARTQKSYQIDGWDDFPLTDWIREHLGVSSVALENDADAAGLAECRFGAGCGHSPLVYITVGSGIGGALIVDDRIYRGAGRGATEIGHLRVPYGKGPDVAWRELELVASGWAIAAAAKDVAQQKLLQKRTDWVVLARAGFDPTQITAAMVADAAAAGDGDAAAILDNARLSFAFALTQAIALLAPRRIVIGGGVSLIGENDWFEPIRRTAARDVFPPFQGGTTSARHPRRGRRRSRRPHRRTRCNRDSNLTDPPTLNELDAIWQLFLNSATHP